MKQKTTSIWMVHDEASANLKEDVIETLWCCNLRKKCWEVSARLDICDSSDSYLDSQL